VTTESLNLEPAGSAPTSYVINYARAEDIRKTVEPLIDAAGGGRLIVDARSNALVISERPTACSASARSSTASTARPNRS
jgi:type IV pilus assembly protein PilQ